MTRIYHGLAIDGPAFGKHLTSHATHIKVAVPDQMALVLRRPRYDPEALAQNVVYNEVVYLFSAGVWACGEYLEAWRGWLPDPGQSAREGTGRDMRQDANGRRWVS